MVNQHPKYNIRIFMQLVRRDLFTLKPRLLSKLIDATIIMAIQVFLFGSLMPMLGMPKTLIAPTFIGGVLILMFSLCHGINLRIIFDLDHPRYIEYQMILPIGKAWLFAALMVNFILEIGLITLPLFTLGIILLGDNFVTINGNALQFFGIYLLTLIFFASLFIMLAIKYPLRWSFDNLWPRILTPLSVFGAVSFVWKDVYALSPIIGSIFLLNPFTYVAEGIRSTLIGGDHFLPVWLCYAALLIAIGCNCFLLRLSIQKRLDPI